MSDLAEFLLARIAEDEQVARETEHADGPETLEWRSGGPRHLRFDNGCRESYAAVFAGSWDRILVARDDVAGGPVAAHIARWDPSRVLAKCAADRRIVEHHKEVLIERLDDEFPGDSCDALCEVDNDDFPCETLRLLALPYADHPDYDPDWRP